MPDSISSYRAPSPLTESKLEQMPGYSRRRPPVGSEDNKDGHFTYSTLHDLESMEHDTIATRSSKVQMVNMTANTINERPKDRSVTAVVLGSSFLMSPELIHLQLTDGKKSASRWRGLDWIYVKSAVSDDIFTKGRKARIQFGKDKNAKAFSSSRAYLSKKENGSFIADEDKKGDVVIYLENLTTMLPADYEKMPVSSRENGFAMRGKPLDENDIEKANTILLTISHNNPGEVTQLSNFSKDLQQGIAFSSSTMKCFPRRDGTYGYVVGGDVPKSLAERVEKQVDQVSGKLLKHTPMEKLNAGIDACIEGIVKYNKNIIALKTIFSDLDRSVDELIEHFSDAEGSVTIAKLENSIPELTTIKS